MNQHTIVPMLVAAAGLASAIAPAGAQVIRRDGSLHYPPGADIPRYTSPVEAEWLRRNPGYQAGGVADAVTAPPTGPIHCAAEYEPMEAIMVAWVSTQQTIIGQIGKWTTTTGNAELHVMLQSAANQSAAASTLTAAGANMAKVKYFTPTAGLNSVWCRDYGPRYIYEGECRAVVDHMYNRSTRTADNVLPDFYALQRKHAFYQLGINSSQLIHGGGNYHLDGLNRGFATRLTVNENDGTPPTGFAANNFTESQIVGIWGTYQGVQQTFFDAFPLSVDATQHLDMWMQLLDDNKVLVTDWPNNVGSAQDLICDAAAAHMAGQGYTVYRTSSYSIGGTHYTYSNMVMCNDVVMVPSYTNATVSPNNAAAVATLQAALPSKTIVQINCDGIIGLAGAVHCIVMHIPKHRGAAGPGGGLAPTAFVKAPVAGESVPSGGAYPIRWISDDDVQATTADVEYSLSGGAWVPLAMWSPNTGAHTWNTPAVHVNRARVRVTAWDAQGNAGSHESGSFRIGNPCYANCDDSTASPVLNVSDFTCFLQVFAGGDSYANCDASTAAPQLNVADFTCFLQKFAAGCS